MKNQLSMQNESSGMKALYRGGEDNRSIKIHIIHP